MKAQWIDFLKKIQYKIDELEEDIDFCAFRGQSDSSRDLLPSLFHQTKKEIVQTNGIDYLETALYFDFVTNAGQLLRPQITSWEILFEMRHHGIPTRILDWTESFGTALYFALNGSGKKPAIWILDPYTLNEESLDDASIPNPLTDLKFDYCEAFLDKTVKPYTNPIAIVAPRTTPRLFAQKGLFTLQGSSEIPLNKNKKVKESVSKFAVPVNCIDDAKNFLKLAGINHYSIFPDLDGLAKHLVNLYELE